METLVETDDILKSNETQEDEMIETTEEVENKEEMDQITKCGFEKATNIVKSNLYWVVIDNALGKYSLK